MSEDIVVSSQDEPSDGLTKAIDDEVKSEKAIAPKAQHEKADDDDLEDGEIDDDDDNDEPIATIDSKIVGAATTGIVAAAAAATAITKKMNQMSPVHNAALVMEMKNDTSKKSKSKKHQALEDDFAGAVESAIAAALKKDGIMPPMPKILESREEIIDKQSDKEVILSKSSRRRKRRKLRDERDKEKDKKKRRGSSPDSGHLTSIQQPGDELDDDEMLCVRGGSPPPSGLMLPLPPLDPSISSKKDNYESDDSYSSYDSYDSAHNYPRYTSSRKKDGNSGSSTARSKRKERSGRRDEDRRSEKRNRRNYDDSGGEDKYQDRHPQQPRKMELCKFYLMECCAKKDKCSYMHSDFPCKYYYLGMECVYRSACKFSHGKPLTDQLRNILLKHLETAPKEILGTFRRISRENAINLINATHEKICHEHGVENTLASPTITTQSIVQTQASGLMRNGELQVQQQQLLQQLQLQQQSQQGQSEIIPSLLDIVINPPHQTQSAIENSLSSTVTPLTGTSASPSLGGVQNNNNKSENKRKSRWCDSVATANTTIAKQNNLEPPSSNAPSYLDLKNLTGILSPAHINKLSQFGVVNLEQINQLTLSQLNNIGLTIAEISEIQLNARNMAKLGVVGVQGDASSPIPITSLAAPIVSLSSATITSSQDVDMRFLPSCLPLTTSTSTTSTVTSDRSAAKEITLASPDRQTMVTGAIGATGHVAANQIDAHCTPVTMGGIDYSQYLRDSNLDYDRNDPLDDEKDEEQLVIDDQDLDALEENSHNDSTNKDASENDSKGSTSFSYGGGESNDSRLPPAIQLSDKVQNLLKDPANLYTVNVSALLKTNELSPNATLKSDCFPGNFDDDSYYGISANTNRHDIDAREDHRDPRLPDSKDDFRDPRLIGNRISEQSSRSTRSFLYRRNSNSDGESGRSRSHSPIAAANQHQTDTYTSIYDRQSMYDWTPKCIQDDVEYSKKSTKADKDMRLAGFLDSSNSDIDLRLPFQPVKNIQIAKEIDASMSTLLPIPYKIYEIDIPEPKYNDLRQSFQCDDTADPRLRRILGLPELSNSKVLAALGRSSGATIASPSSAESSSSPTREREIPSASQVRGPRVDPRRIAAASVSSTVTSLGATQSTSVQSGNPQQNVEIRMLLQKSDWYKNLNSKFKIMVNQQLALVSTELKRFHQDPSPNKVFDIQFILNNQNLQQILTNLGIYIDDNGQVAHIDSENDMIGGSSSVTDFNSGSNQMIMMNNPNMMTMQQQMEFLRGPPPNMNMIGHGGNGSMGPGGSGGSQQSIFNGPGGMQSFGRNSRLSILGMPPGGGGGGGSGGGSNSGGSGGGGGGGGFNPFAGNPGDNGGNMMDQKFCGSNNPFGNSFGSNGGNFGGQQMNRGNRNTYNRQGSGPGGNNGSNRINQNRRIYKSNNSRDRRGGSNNIGSSSAIGGGGNGNLIERSGMGQNSNGGAEES